MGLLATLSTMSAYTHGEAFCRMQYESDDGNTMEILWNSRDGVTPFCILAKDGKTELRAKRGGLFEFCPDHNLQSGDRYFTSPTEETARGEAERLLVLRDGTEYEVPLDQREAFVISLTEGLLNQGPFIATFTE